MHLQFRKRNGSVQSFKNKLIVFLVFIFSSASFAQDDIIEELLDAANILNQTVLELTALSDEEENSIGEELDKEISRDLRITRERKFNIKRIFNNLLRHTKRDKINYRYKVVATEDVNAYAIAGGQIYINTGLFDFLDTEDEIAFVIAHEFSHNELKHCIKRIQYAAIASSIDPTIGEIVRVAYGIYSMPYNKYDEFEADENGVLMMEKAGYNRKGAESFFDKLYELEKKYGVENRDELNDFISTHPTSLERKRRVSTY